jgi:hypothetical protein
VVWRKKGGGGYSRCERPNDRGVMIER